jgi:hypothetical protein
MSIQKLYFGKDDAETDFTSSGLLRESFVKTDVYVRTKARIKTLVIGRKGSGKSALCLMLNRQLCNETNTNSCIVTPDAISADEIRRFEMVGVNEQQSKKLVWQYVFLIQICKFLLSIARRAWASESEWPLEIKKVRQFLIDNHEVDDLNFQEKFWKVIHRISATLKLGAFGNSLELGMKDAPNAGLQLSTQLDFLEGWLTSQLRQLQQYRLYILVDKVDEIWSDDPPSSYMAVGLLMAAKDINIKFENVSCIVFLRSDIYEQLQFFDKDKLRGAEEAILWTKETLPELVLARAQISTGNRTMTADQLWSRYFPARIQQRLTVEFILSHTLMRPRDVIQLCNLCTDLARRENSSSVLEKHTLQALDVYSSWKLNDLIGEYRVNYPFLNDLLLLFTNISYVLPRKRLEEMYGRVQDVLKGRYPDYTSVLGTDAILNILYGVGFLGVQRKHETLYYYEVPGTVEASDNVFVIHPAFRNALKSTSSIDIPQYQQGIDWRQQYAELIRSRSPVRGAFEVSQQISKELRHPIDRIARLRERLVTEGGVPAEVSSEVSRSLGAIISELLETSSVTLDPAYLRMPITRAARYLMDLKANLEGNGYLNSRSSLSYYIDELIDELNGMRNRLY